jgi:hypothetical protein
MGSIHKGVNYVTAIPVVRRRIESFLNGGFWKFDPSLLIVSIYYHFHVINDSFSKGKSHYEA